MAGESVREMPTYREILSAAEGVKKALDAIARSDPDDDRATCTACAAIDAERAALAIGILVDLYEPKPRA